MIIDSFWILLIVCWTSMFLSDLVGLVFQKRLTKKNILVSFFLAIPLAVILSLVIALILLITGSPTRLELWPI